MQKQIGLRKTLQSFGATSFFSGLNHAYADCDGDGEIGEDDFEVVSDNFGETQPTVTPDVFASGVGGVDPELKLTNLTGAVGLGSTVDFALDLGDGTLPVNDFYGIAFTVNYDPGIFDEEDLELELTEGTWITTMTGDDFEDLELLEVEDQMPGVVHFAITRNDQMPITGGGEIGRFSIVVEDVIVGLMTDTTTLIQIDKVRMITDDMTEVLIVPDTFPLTITDGTTGVSNKDIDKEIIITPNPTSGLTKITLPLTTILNTKLYDFIGNEIPVQIEQGSSNEVIVQPYSSIPNGIYILSVLSEKGIISRTISIAK